MTRRAGYRLQGRGLVKRTGSPVQGFAATEEAVWAAVHGSPSLCHPELVSGSGFRTDRGCRFEKSYGTQDADNSS